MQGDISTAFNINAVLTAYGSISGSLTVCAQIDAAINAETGTYALVDSDGNYITDSSGNIITGRTRGSRISGDLLPVSTIDGSISVPLAISAEISVPKAIGGDPYTGNRAMIIDGK